jgi:chemotaxis protein MotB
MASARARRGGRRRGHVEESHSDERWLLTYSDMITLLMALFIVMFAMSNVNEQKFESLQQSLSEAFSGRILGGESIAQTGGSVQAPESNPAVQPQTLAPMTSGTPEAKDEQEDFRRLKARIDGVIAEQGLQRKVASVIEKRGLAVRVMSDGLLFESGSADVRPEAAPVLAKLGKVLAVDKAHPFRIEGHTDDVPVSGRYPSNWELSTARSSAVVRAFMSGSGIAGKRFEAVGRAELEPLRPNTSPAARSANRRVEIVLPRRHQEPSPLTPRQELEAQIQSTTASTATEAPR